MTKANKAEKESPQETEGRFAVPIETQVAIAKRQQELALVRYGINVRRGRAWAKESRKAEHK